MKRNKFSLSNYKNLTMNQGYLVPIGLQEVLPGDTFQHATSALIRVSPLLAPVMHPVHVKIHHWFVPTRIIWEDWEDFITGGEDGMDNSAVPAITIDSGTGWAIGSLADYLGIPTGVDDITVSALPFRAYATIWNEFYRDQQLSAKAVVALTSGADSTTSQSLLSPCWEKDYFTSARPDPQLGPEVTLPLGTRAPVKGIGKLNTTFPTAAQDVYETDGAAQVQYANAAVIDNTTNSHFYVEEGITGTSGLDDRPNIWADLSEASAATINEFREALALQRYQEARSRYGARYTEYLRYLGVRSSDARLQRPEYLGGGKQTIQFSEVLQTSPNATTGTTGTTGVGALKGHGIGAMRSNRYRRFFEEHGYVVSLMSVQPKTMYFEGVHRMWSRTTKEHYFQRELQHIGQQEVLNKELYVAGASPNGVFGYQDRYDEYRRAENTLAGEFRDSTANFWHMARDFSAAPELNESFVTSNPTNRIYASTATHQLYCMVHHSIQARRMLAKVGTSFTY